MFVHMHQGSLQLGGHGGPLNHFEIPPNQKVTKFICCLYIIIRAMWLAPKVILSNQVDNNILAIITKPSKMLERTLKFMIHKAQFTTASGFLAVEQKLRCGL